MATRVCGKCKSELDATQFSKCSSQKDGLMYWCKNCINAHTSNRRNKLVVDYSSQSKICHLCHEEKPRSQFFKSKVSVDGMTAYCKECYPIWKNNNMARKRGIPGIINPHEWKTMLKTFNYTCLRCKRTNIKLSIDHIIPVSNQLCINTIDNIQPLCQSCNSRKGKKTTDYRPLAEIFDL